MMTASYYRVTGKPVCQFRHRKVAFLLGVCVSFHGIAVSTHFRTLPELNLSIALVGPRRMQAGVFTWVKRVQFGQTDTIQQVLHLRRASRQLFPHLP